MSKTYNGRFDSPEEPKGGGLFVAVGCAMIPLWPTIFFLIASIGCFVVGGKMNARKRMYRDFHEMCTVIGMRERVSIKELAKVCGKNKSETRKYLQQMIAEGYFGGSAVLDLNREELVIQCPQSQTTQSRTGSWKDVVLDVLNALRREHQRSQAQKKKRPAADVVETEFVPERKKQSTAPAQLGEGRQEAQTQPVQEKKQARPAPEKRRPGKVGMAELEKTLNELYEINTRIEDAAVSGRIDRIGTLTAAIFTAVIENPGREGDVRKFMNYYLPQTLKLLKSYEMLEEQKVRSENIVESMRKIENVLDMLIEAYEKQLDRLFRDDAMDIATDIQVLETMMAGDGLSSKGQMRMGASGR